MIHIGTRLAGPVARLGAAGQAAVQRLLAPPGAPASPPDGAARHVELAIGGRTVIVDLPITYRRADVFTALFPARYRAVAQLLPPALHPLRFGYDHTLVAVSALNYLDSSIGTYGEVSIATPCTTGMPLPAAAITALQSLLPGFGYFILHLPVTTDLALEVGRRVWGYPKFVADIEFSRTPICQRVRLGGSGGGPGILDLSVAQRGVPVPDSRPFVTYSTTVDGRLLRTTIANRALYQVMPGGGGATLELGDHPVASQLRRLGVSGTPVFALNYRSFSAALHPGRTVGRVDEPYVPAGQDVDLRTVEAIGRRAPEAAPAPGRRRRREPSGQQRP